MAYRYFLLEWQCKSISVHACFLSSLCVVSLSSYLQSHFHVLTYVFGISPLQHIWSMTFTPEKVPPKAMRNTNID
jgi:hypothetical protein